MMAATETSDFFKKERSASEIRAELLPLYFAAWCSAILANQKQETGPKALYMDLAAALTHDTAFVKVLDTIFRSGGKSINLNQAVHTFYHNPAPGIADALQAGLPVLSFYEELMHKPVDLREADNYEQLQEQLAHSPALTFLNPFTDIFAQEFLLSTVKEWGTDLVMLFDFESINAAVKKGKTSSQLQELFGARLAQIKSYYETRRDAAKRETFVLTQFNAIFDESGYKTFQFKINSPHKTQLNQYLLLATKTEAVYSRIKELMLKYSEFQEDGVPLFGVNLKQQQMGLFQEHYTYSIVNLVNELAQKASMYSNKTLQFIYEKDNIATNYSRENYRTAFQQLKELGKVIFVNPKTGQTISAVAYTSIIRYKK